MGINIKRILRNIVYMLLISGVLMLNNYIQFKQFERILVLAIEKNTTEISNNFDKMRTKKDGVINLNLNNEIAPDTTKTKKWYQFKK